MFSKLFLSFIAILQNQELHATAQEIARSEKTNSLTQLISLLTIAILTLIILLSINIYKNYKLRLKINTLEGRLK